MNSKKIKWDDSGKANKKGLERPPLGKKGPKGPSLGV